jgi:hypothetical protein
MIINILFGLTMLALYIGSAILVGKLLKRASDQSTVDPCNLGGRQ